MKHRIDEEIRWGAFIAHIVRIETKWTTKEAEQHVLNKTSRGILSQGAILNNTYIQSCTTAF